MAGNRRNLARIIDSLLERRGPLLSAYLNVNAEAPENQGRAYLVRLRDAMDDLGAPEELRERIGASLEEKTHPRARTLAIFGDADGSFEVYRLQVDLPESFRWGEPDVSPLVLALDEYEPYGAVVLDAERFRFFVVSPLATPEAERSVKGNGFLELDIRPSEPYPRSHGSRDADPAGRTQQELAHRYYKEMGELARDVTFREGVRRLILAGPQEVRSGFREAMPGEIQDRILAEGHVDLGAPEGELIELLEDLRKQAVFEHDKELLEEVRENGVWGLDEVLDALQEQNRIYHLIALWDIEGEVRWCDDDSLAIQDITSEECPFCGRKTRMRPTRDALVALGRKRGAQLDLLRGENQNTTLLREEFEGIAGLTRF
ncbi:hypothetical protein [Rubrobacter calidifluminis]|uniref:baeRF10 domain-containing protein n=1 Tax=Rubrobacter calidifluminis TaxID=1392640 RepID=UPI00235E6471|nr:hypothetical protein [Rubrobacter calidifluminis]